MTDFRLVPAGGGWRVEVAGLDVSHLVHGVEFGVYTGVINTSTLDGHESAHLGQQGRPGVTLLLLTDPDVHLPNAKVEIDVDTAALLERLGWTPPPRKEMK